ncbi:hypothetical protein PN498_17605 [Oscillatoria sp. CS-180]|uniref:hypothetical protein n=1 Tax=Oscillatoria sp. CS-180 TaxID=3021720 RepID=UPI00232FE7C3|nr:hypothetical protein [Oscillatoria sp. CS-180]MDB9527815.1 hypothetical protein [Oscillatoria sp. CS-180]
MNKLSVIGIGVGVLAIGAYTGASVYAAKMAEDTIDKAIESVSDEVKIEYSDVSVNPIGFDVLVKDIKVSPVGATAGEAVLIDKVIVREMDDKSDFPTVLDASIEGIQVDFDQIETPSIIAFLERAGYQESLSVNIDTKYEYKENRQEVSLDRFRVSAEDVGDLEVAFKLSNFDPNVGASEQLILHRAEVVYEDNSFTEKLLESLAAENNQDVQQFKAQLQAELTQTAQFFVSPDNQTAMIAFEEAMTFIDNPNGFSILAEPQQPLSLRDLMLADGPQDWVDMLNLKIESY